MPQHSRVRPKNGKSEGVRGAQQRKVCEIGAGDGYSSPRRKGHRRRGPTRKEWWTSPCCAKETSSSRADQRIDDLQCCPKSPPCAPRRNSLTKNELLHRNVMRGNESCVACVHTHAAARGEAAHVCYGDWRALALRSPPLDVALRPGHCLGPLADDS